jgi:hypothetical protein
MPFLTLTTNTLKIDFYSTPTPSTKTSTTTSKN